MEYYSAFALKRFIELSGQKCLIANIPAFTTGGALLNAIMPSFPSGRIPIAVAINTTRSHYPLLSDKIDHLISWIIDGLDWSGKPVDDRDWIVGYCYDFGYAKHTHPIACPVPMEVYNSSCNIVPSHQIVFAGNRGLPAREWISSEWFMQLIRSYNIPINCIRHLVDRIEYQYEQGERLIGYREFDNFACYDEELKNCLATLLPNDRRTLMNIYLYWGINESAYRQTVVKWIIDLGVDIQIAGCGWEWTGKRSVGFIDGLEALQSFWKSGVAGLHLNSLETSHHRIYEIAMAGRPCLTRGKTAPSNNNNMFIPEEHERWYSYEIRKIMDAITKDNELISNPFIKQTPNITCFKTKHDLELLLKTMF